MARLIADNNETVGCSELYVSILVKEKGYALTLIISHRISPSLLVVASSSEPATALCLLTIQSRI